MNTAHGSPPAPHGTDVTSAAHAHAPIGSDTLLLSTEQAQAIVRLVEASPGVRRRYQFFVWTQSQMQALLPHQVLVCGAYHRQRRTVALDAFHNIVLPPDVLASLTSAGSALVDALVTCWVDGRCRPRAVALDRLDGAAADAAQGLRGALGYTHLLVHGVSRPQRPTEIESLFIFGGIGGDALLAQRSACLDLLLPQLHSTWQRVSANELELQRPVPPAAPERPGPASTAAARGAITVRECQILGWVREGKSNQQIADVLGISPLTVKNHIQKILRKLGAGNRAQAVALALARQLIDATHAAPEG